MHLSFSGHDFLGTFTATEVPPVGSDSMYHLCVGNGLGLVQP